MKLNSRNRPVWLRALRSPIAILPLLALALALTSALILTQEGDAQTTAKPTSKPSPKPATSATAPATTATTPAAAGPDSQLVTHAKQASITACLPALGELSRLTLDAPHMVLSTWNKTDANDHMFSSVVGLKYDNQVAPHAVAIVAASPNSKKSCDAESVQIQPSTLTCDAIAKNVTQANMKSQDLNGVTLISGESALRFALLPTAGNGCAVVAIGTYFAK